MTMSWWLNVWRIGRVVALLGCLGAPVARVWAQTPLFVPDVPPRAALIQVFSPDSAGEVTVIGAPGAVPPGGVVVLVTLDTGHAILAQAAADGRFAARLFGPRGSSILVKAAPAGTDLSRVREELMLRSEGNVAVLPGTIVAVPPPLPTGTGVPFAGVGLVRFQGLPAWTVEGTINRQDFQAGDTLRVQGTLRIVSPALAGAGPMRGGVGLALERLSGPDGAGAFRTNSFASVFLTPTGLPIERRGQPSPGFEPTVNLDFTRPSAGRAEAVFELSLTLPADLPAGYYRPYLGTSFEGVPADASGVLLQVGARHEHFNAYLPVIRLGAPALPRLPWVLLMDTLANGSRGVSAVEDRSRFGVAQRIVTTSETFVVPRVDGATGRPLTYRLEPFAPTVSVGDRHPPDPPLIPFRFPSGRLTVRVQKPDGSVEVLGPVPFAQARMKSLADSRGGVLEGPSGHITDAYELSTLDPRFEVQFATDGRHVITVDGAIDDLWGHTWVGGGTYEVHVARPLSLDTGVLPMTPFEAGDVLTPTVVISPPVPADIELRVRLAPDSEAGRMVERVVKGRANRFGYFHPLGGGGALNQPGEYRVDVTASFRDDQGTLWMGTRTWGSVVAPRDASLVAHGRRGLDNQPTIGPQWFFRSQTGQDIPNGHVHIPFSSGDVQWLVNRDSANPHVTIGDPAGSLAALLRARAIPTGPFPVVLFDGPGTFDERVAAGEIPLFSSTASGRDPHLDPGGIDLWAYSYRSVQRPLVRVREEIGEDHMVSPYWRFDAPYGMQIGVGPLGDLPNDIKFQYGGVVVRGMAVGQPRYAIYGSLFVLVPDNDPRGGTRTFPPFQGNGGGPSGGPIMTLKGREIDLFIHLTGVRPGSVLEVGDTFALSGAIGPTHPALVSYTVTKPDGERLSFSGRANRVGYYYRPEHDFLVDQPGLYTVDLRVTFDGVISAGQVTAPFPTGDVLGTANGRFFVYVVRRDSRPLDVPLPRTTFLPPPAALDVSASVPAGLLPNRAHVTAMMPGFVLESRDLPPSSTLAYRYDPVSLARDFPNLDVEFQGQPDAADATTLSLFASGTTPEGAPAHAARVLALHGPELLNLPLPAALLPQLAVTTDRTSYDRTQPLTLSAHFAQGSTTALADVYLGLLRPDGTFASVLLQDGQFTLIPTGGAPAPLLRNSPLRLDFSAPVLTHPWAPADRAGSYTAFAVLVRAGQDPFNRANWLAVGTTSFTLSL